MYVELLDPVELANKFPWLSTKGVSLASFGKVWYDTLVSSILRSSCTGFRDEGWFDPWILLSGFKKKAISLGADYISAEVVGVNIENDSVKSVKVQSRLGHVRVYILCHELSCRFDPLTAELPW